MKMQTCIIGLLLTSATLSAFAEQPMAGMEMRKESAQIIHQGAGKVLAVDRAKSSVKLAHEAIKSLGWPAMTMSFGVEKATLLDGLKAGDAVRFELKQLASKKWEIVNIWRS